MGESFWLYRKMSLSRPRLARESASGLFFLAAYIYLRKIVSWSPCLDRYPVGVYSVGKEIPGRGILVAPVKR